MARVVAALVLTLGLFSLVAAALLLALDGDLSHPIAWACMALTTLLVALRLRREYRHTPFLLSWCPHSAGFHIPGVSGTLELVRVWQGPGWVTLGLRPQAAPRRIMSLVVWKSAIPAPLWNELALRLEAGSQRANSAQNKENP